MGGGGGEGVGGGGTNNSLPTKKISPYILWPYFCLFVCLFVSLLLKR